MKPRTSRGRSLREPTQKWSDIEEHFRRLSIEHGFGGEMLNLVRHIRTTGLADRLFAFTSMHDLIIGSYPELERHIETLHVSYNAKNSAFHLEYYASPTRSPEVTRTYSSEVGLQKFHDFIGYLKW
jgi:hypothetical protein